MLVYAEIMWLKMLVDETGKRACKERMSSQKEGGSVCRKEQEGGEGEELRIEERGSEGKMEEEGRTDRNTKTSVHRYTLEGIDVAKTSSSCVERRAKLSSTVHKLKCSVRGRDPWSRWYRRRAKAEYWPNRR